MSRRLTNVLILALVVAEVATGLIAWVIHEARALPLYDIHRFLGIALVLLLLWKQAIVRDSLGRRLPRRPFDASILPSAAAGVALAASLLFALAWSLQVISFDWLWGYSPLNLHVLLALSALPFFVAHLARRWERRPAARDLVTRRSLVHLLGLAAGSALVWNVADRVAEARAAGVRRASGSKHAGSFTGNAFPTTIWTFDTVPDLSPSTWRLHVRGNVAAPLSLSYADLLAAPPISAPVVLDCTGGWWSEQLWTGPLVGHLLTAARPRPDARWVDVVSVTGHRWTFALDTLASTLLATHVGGEPLSPAHGFPARLVAPGHRGFQWIKWVDRLEVL